MYNFVAIVVTVESVSFILMKLNYLVHIILSTVDLDVLYDCVID